MPKQQKTYTREFKLEAVQLVMRSGNYVNLLLKYRNKRHLHQHKNKLEFPARNDVEREPKENNRPIFRYFKVVVLLFLDIASILDYGVALSIVNLHKK
jgi:hypothetical protein